MQLPKTGLRPLPFELPQFTSAALAAQAARAAAGVLYLPQLLPRQFTAVDDDATPARPAAPPQPQGPNRSPDLPPETIAGGLAALRVILGAEKFANFMRAVRIASIGSATAGTAALWAGGAVFDPLRFVYETGMRTIIPGKPVKPIQGLLTHEFETALALMHNMFDPTALGITRTGVVQQYRARIQREIDRGRVSISDPKVQDVARRFGIEFFAPGQRQAEQAEREERARRLWDRTDGRTVVDDAGADPQLPDLPAASVDP